MKYLSFVLIFCVVVISGCRQSAETAQPNIIIILTDDHGYSDLSCQGVVADVKTPYIDELAAGGARMTAAYATAPQCVPSRAGIISGMYQQKFGVDENNLGPLPIEISTIGDRISAAGYKTGLVGKWHLDPARIHLEWIEKNLKGGISNLAKEALPYQSWNRGFQDVFQGNISKYYTTHDAKGKLLDDVIAQQFTSPDRIGIQTNAALRFLDRNHKDPFFLYLSYYAPHVPLRTTRNYLDRFPGEMPERRRYALALISSIDDGVGSIMNALDKYGIEENTLIIFMSDNGAPMGKTRPDDHVNNPKGNWDGSINDPFVGEKGMLTEGGIRVPFVAYWKGKILPGQVIDEPVSTLDASATAVALAGQDISDLDGINLVPHLTKERLEWPYRMFYWRWRNQEAIRNRQWKMLRLSDGTKYAFDLTTDQHENMDLKTERPDVIKNLSPPMNYWLSKLQRPRMKHQALPIEEKAWYRHYFRHLHEKIELPQ